MGVEAYPLCWPEGWTRENCKEESNFATSGTKAHKMLMDEIRRMGGTGIVLSTNVPLRQDGMIRMDREPVDAGVAVYFTRKQKQVVFACDRFDLLRDNMLSLAKTIEALRGIERWGASEMLERAYSGFKQLNAENGEAPWWVVLGVAETATLAEINLAWQTAAKAAHPDVAGGDAELMKRLNVAVQQARKARAK